MPRLALAHGRDRLLLECHHVGCGVRAAGSADGLRHLDHGAAFSLRTVECRGTAASQCDNRGY
jgi:hypothetical protein